MPRRGECRKTELSGGFLGKFIFPETVDGQVTPIMLSLNAKKRFFFNGVGSFWDRSMFRFQRGNIRFVSYLGLNSKMRLWGETLPRKADMFSPLGAFSPQ